jgi:hypothetical protein
MTDMNRRRFMKALSSTLLLPLSPALNASAWSSSDKLQSDQFFYDDRFAGARKLALELACPGEIIPVQSDITDIWRAGLNRVCRQGPMVMRGVTTESVHFCLRTMVADCAEIESQISRVDRDLYLWTIKSEPTTHRGVKA